MDFKQYQQKSYTAIQKHAGQEDEIVHWLIGLSEEVGEVSNLFKHCFYGGEEVCRSDVADELGDVLWHVSALCSALNIDLGTVAKLNVAKLQHRYGGEDFNTERSINRHELQEEFKQSERYQKLIRNLERK